MPSKETTPPVVPCAPAPVPLFLVRTKKPFNSSVKHNQRAFASINDAIKRGFSYQEMCTKGKTPIKGGRPLTAHTVARYMVNRLKLFTTTETKPSL